MIIQTLTAADVPALKAVIDANDLFPSGMLDDMTAPALSNPEAPELWLTGQLAGPQALAYAVPERMADRVWNLLLIAVHPDVQGMGHGSALLAEVEARLTRLGARLLIVETSGLPDFAATRAFYSARGYHPEARIRDFYQPGEDKVVFCKQLNANA